MTIAIDLERIATKQTYTFFVFSISVGENNIMTFIVLFR